MMLYKSFSRTLLVFTMTMIVAPSGAEEVATKNETIKLAQGDWLGADMVQTQIIVKGLEELGYQYEISTVKAAVFFAASARGDLAFQADINWPQEEPAFKAVSDKLKLFGSGVLDGAGGLNGYLIDKKTSVEYGITNIEQLKDPKLAKLFDSDGDGLANLNQCGAGTGCGDTVNHQVKAFGLQETVKPI